MDPAPISALLGVPLAGGRGGGDEELMVVYEKVVNGPLVA
jgi:hypothetical protein